MGEKPKSLRHHPNHRVIAAAYRPTIIFLTICTKTREPILATDAMHTLLCDHWSAASAWVVGRYVVMPDHVHLFAAPGEPELPLTNWVSFWKRRFTRALGRPIWQEDYWDTTIRSAEHFQEKWDYVRHNPKRRGLVVDSVTWPYQGELNNLPWRS